MPESHESTDDDNDFLMELLTYRCPQTGRKRTAGCLETRTAHAISCNLVTLTFFWPNIKTWMVQMFLWVTRTPSPIKIPLVTAHCHTELPDHEHDDGELFSEYLHRHELSPTSNHNGPEGDIALVESSSAIATQWLRVLFGRDALSTKNGGTCCPFVFIPIMWKTQGLLNDVQEQHETYIILYLGWKIKVDDVFTTTS